jgi:hypothetical protein
MNRRTVSILVALAGVGALVLGGCAEIDAERQGTQLGEAICDLRTADNADDADQAIQDIQDELTDVSRIVGRGVDEDVSDIQENLDDLREHVVNGQQTLRDQDVNAIRRNVEDIADHVEGTQKAAYDGVAEGLADCS